MSQPSAQTTAAGRVEPYDPLEVLASTLTAPHEEALAPAEVTKRIGELLNVAREREHEACRALVERLTPAAGQGRAGCRRHGARLRPFCVE